MVNRPTVSTRRHRFGSLLAALAVRSLLSGCIIVHDEGRGGRYWHHW
jgi:hypothetical protein